ncbi:hypothetical protein [Aurantiacibacter gangjinensis]|uniref:hypothetical protein n=1 Tax=Aurantiacibacter gangjinensis TaxID=502682 RepID=UPI00138FFE81|nr:hypothetical protein [Aurantiacibacter gangjinensis]
MVAKRVRDRIAIAMRRKVAGGMRIEACQRFAFFLLDLATHLARRAQPCDKVRPFDFAQRIVCAAGAGIAFQVRRLGDFSFEHGNGCNGEASRSGKAPINAVLTRASGFGARGANVYAARHHVRYRHPATLG